MPDLPLHEELRRRAQRLAELTAIDDANQRARDRPAGREWQLSEPPPFTSATNGHSVEDHR